MIASKTTRFFFDQLDVAAEALILVLEDARETDAKYSFGGLSAQQIYASGLILEGEIDAIAAKVEELPGTTRHDE
jgi:hypothetical protein